ncbi:hypothetical protein DXG01_008962 [Tephrocybe rancida]|nr:hypothetical protein DXG01_008962 [Tephrocybe rancida]
MWYGFGTDVDFDKLVKNNHFLFRVYTPKERSPFADDSEPFFVAPKFNERYTRSPEEIRGSLFDDNVHRHIGTYEDVARHMDWSTKSTSPYISTSFSFIWSIWEALRRYHQGVKKDIEISVIDASAVSSRATTAVQLLQSGLSSSRRTEHWKWYRYAQESQSVLIHECIPPTAVLTSIPLIYLLEKLPSYFLRHDVASSSKNSLAGIGWDYGDKKRNYRRFCQDMSQRFLQSLPETRLEDTTAGSVRLAMAFLRPWFHRCVQDDFQTATITLCALSFNIAQWPGQWWAQEHSELWNLIRAMVLSLAEEVRNAEGNHHSKEVVRLQGVILELEDAVEKYKGEIRARATRKSPRLLMPLLIPPTLRPAAPLISPSPFRLAPPSGPPKSATQIPRTPITPPTSPIRSGLPRTFLSDSSDLPSSTSLSPFVGSDSPGKEIASPPAMSHSVLASLNSPDEVQFTIVPPSSIEPPDTPVSPLLAPVSTDKSSAAEVDLVDNACEGLMAAPCTHGKQHRILRKPPTIAETASCVVTGFLVGAFVTLCLLSPQRRTLLTHLT